MTNLKIKTKKTFAAVLLFMALLFIVHLIVNSVERSECRSWQDKASVAAWQAQQCEHHNIKLNGQVRPGTIAK